MPEGEEVAAGGKGVKNRGEGIKEKNMKEYLIRGVRHVLALVS